MYGRYGGDNFSIALLAAGCLVSILGFFIYPLTFVAYAIYFYAIFRAFSKNYAARQRELSWFMHFWAPIHSWLSVQKRRLRDIKRFKYFKCPGCRQNLRAPRGSGKIMVTCQKCHKEFKTKV